MSEHNQTGSRRPAPASTDDSIATRASLLDRLKDREDQASWQEFFDAYWQLNYRVGKKAGLTDAEAQNVLQETVVSIAKNPQAGTARVSGWPCHFPRLAV